MLDLMELSARWTRTREMMERLDLDVVIAIDTSRDEILLSTQRWLTGFTPLGGPAAALLFRDGHVELVSQWLGKTVPAFYAGADLPIETVPGYSPQIFAERIGKAGARKIGYAEDGCFPASIYQALRDMPSSPALIDISAEIIALRMRKSAAEIATIRKSCAIADKIWENMDDIFRVGRKHYEIVADISHLARLEGAEGGFYLMGKLPFLGMPMRVLADPDEVVADTRYLVEVSPRFDGYYSQLTGPVTTRPDDADAARALADVVAAKEFAQPLMVPGADLSAIAVEIETFLKDRGHMMISRSLGHFCGMALEEPRHDPGKPVILESGMTFIFHPVLFSPELASFMRADTYLITPDGAERLNRYGTEMLVAG
ncbi:MAG: M24 family metallopeptidase [Sphingobium sp.]